MEWRVMFLVVFLVFISSFTINNLSVVFPESVEGKILEVPAGALWFNLSSSEPVKRFTLTEFYPDQSFVGRYNIKIESLLYLIDHSPTCSVICWNLWNSSDTPHEMSTSEVFHKTYTYSYSQPTVDDPEFSIQLELKAETEITTQNPVKGWFQLNLVDYGVTDKPDDFTMPIPLDTTTTTTTVTKTETTDSDSKQEVSFINSFFCFLSLGVFFLLKKKFR